MGVLNPEIFRAYDIRGRYSEDFDVSFAQQLGDRASAWLKAGMVVIGRDSRTSSDELAYGLIEGAVQAGAHVVDVGVLSTPQFYWAVRSLGAAGGIMVTASHNPVGQNGFKIVALRDGAIDVIGGARAQEIFASPLRESGVRGDVEYRTLGESYAAAVAAAADWQRGSELLMAVDGPQAVREVLARLGPIAPDHRLAVRFDTDGDRIAFFEDGVPIPADYIFLLLAEKLALKPLVFDLRFSRTVRQRLAARAVPYTVSKVGRLALVETMHTTRAAFGAELSGHYYWSEFGGMESPELTVLRVYQILTQSGQRLSELVAPYRVLHKSEEISIPMGDRSEWDGVVEKLAGYFRNGSFDHTDGLSITFDDWWFNIRPSNTESLLRLVVEANTKNLLDRMVREVLGIVSSGAAL